MDVNDLKKLRAEAEQEESSKANDSPPVNKKGIKNGNKNIDDDGADGEDNYDDDDFN